jgi:hypothetical protein
MQTQGIRVNVKSLYRLNDDNHPVDRLDMRVAGAICQVCDVPLSDWIVFAEESGNLQFLSADKQQRLDVLMEKNNEGLLSEPERVELQSLVRSAEEITLVNAQLLAHQQRQLEPVSAGGAGAPR